MASVRKREWQHNGEVKTAWVVNYTDQGGKRRLKTFERKKDADAYRLKVEIEIERGEHTPNSESCTVEAVCRLFISAAEQKEEEKTLSKNRLHSLRVSVRIHIIPFLGRKKFNELTWNDIEGWIEWMKGKGTLAPRTVAMHRDILRNIETFAIRRNFTKKTVVADVCRDLGRAKPSKVRTFTVEEVKGLLSIVEVRPKGYPHRCQLLLRCVVHLAAFCGLRYGEIMGLALENIDLDGKVLRIRNGLSLGDELRPPKTRAGIRDVPLPAHIGEMLRLWIESYYVPNERFLAFRTSENRQIKNSMFRAAYWIPLLRRADLYKDGDADPFHFHALRHFAASWMIEHGLPLPEVASLLGHSKVDMTLSVYAHAVVGGHRRQETMERMAAALHSFGRDKDATTGGNVLISNS